MKTSKLSADNFKKILDLDGSTPEPEIRSGDTGQLSIDDNIDVQSASSWAPKVARKCESKHWYACGADGRAAGGRAVYGHVITKFSGMGRFTYQWCSAGALRAPELRYESIQFSDAGAAENLNTSLTKQPTISSPTISFSSFHRACFLARTKHTARATILRDCHQSISEGAGQGYYCLVRLLVRLSSKRKEAE